MKKIISILIAAGIIATVGSVVALAKETDTKVPESATTDALPKAEETTNEKATEEVTKNAEAPTENMETSTDSDEATNSDATGTVEGSGDTTDETAKETEVVGTEDIKNGETMENDSEAIDNEDPDIPQTGDNRKAFPAIATLIVSGIALAYCFVKGKKNKSNKNKSNGE